MTCRNVDLAWHENLLQTPEIPPTTTSLLVCSEFLVKSHFQINISDVEIPLPSHLAQQLFRWAQSACRLKIEIAEEDTSSFTLSSHHQSQGLRHLVREPRVLMNIAIDCDRYVIVSYGGYIRWSICPGGDLVNSSI